MKKTALFILLCTLSVRLYAASDAGRTSAPFLKIPIGSRLVGMGEAYTSIADDPYALFGNVAGIAKRRDLELSFSHVEWFGDVDYEFFGFTKSFFKGFFGYHSTIGFSLNYLHLPLFKSYDDWGGVKDNNVVFNNYAFTLGYAQNIQEHLKAGLSFRYIREVFDNTSDGAVTLNVGLLYTHRIPGFSLFGKKLLGRTLDIGFLMEIWSMGTDIIGYSVPFIYKFGFSSNLFEPVLLSVDLHIPLDNRIRLNVGSEWALAHDNFFVRAGYRFFGYKIDSYTVGLGGKFPFDRKIIKIDISYAPASVLGDTFNFTLSMKYPGEISDEKRMLADRLYYKGIYYFVNEDYDKAIELWKEALLKDPDLESANVKIKETEELLKFRKKAEEETSEKYKKELKEAE